jgi:hypothetical protein
METRSQRDRSRFAARCYRPARDLRAEATAGDTAPLPACGRECDPLACLSRSILRSSGGPVLGGRRRTIAGLTRIVVETPLYIAPSRRVGDRRAPWAMPWISPGCAADGCPWDREQTHSRCASTCSRRPTRSTTRSRPGPPPSWPASSVDLWLQVVLHRQLAARRRVRPRDVQAALAQDRPRHPQSSARRRPDRVGRETVSGSASRPRSAPTAAGTEDAARRRRPAPPRRAPRWHRSLDAGARGQPEMQERAAHLGYDWPSLEGVWTRSSRRPTSCATRPAAPMPADRGVRRPAVVLRERRAQARPSVDAEARARGETPSSASIRQRGAPGGATRGVALRDLISRRSTPCGGTARRREEDDVMTPRQSTPTVRADGAAARPPQGQLRAGRPEWAGSPACVVRRHPSPVRGDIVDRVPPAPAGQGPTWPG